MLALAAEHGGNPDDPNKRHPLDFVLWQPPSPTNRPGSRVGDPAGRAGTSSARPWPSASSGRPSTSTAAAVTWSSPTTSARRRSPSRSPARRSSATGCTSAWSGLDGTEDVEVPRQPGLRGRPAEGVGAGAPSAWPCSRHHYRPDWEWTDRRPARAATALAAWRRPPAERPVRSRRGGARPWCAPRLDADLDTPGALARPRRPGGRRSPGRPGSRAAGRYPVGRPRRFGTAVGRRSAAASTQRPTRGHRRPSSEKGNPWQASTSDFPTARPRSSREGTTAFELAASIGPRLAKAALAATVDGVPVDLDGRPARRRRGDRHHRRLASRPGGAAPLDRPCARPGRPPACGPARTTPSARSIEDGFYYDFELPGGAPFSDEDLERIAAEMREIMAEDQPFVRDEHSIDEGLDPLRGPAVQARDHRGGGCRHRRGRRRRPTQAVEPAVSTYRNSPTFTDLCRGPTCRRPAGWATSRSCGWPAPTGAATSTTPQLQRIYGTAWESDRPRSPNTCTASRRPSGATTAGSGRSSTCSPSREEIGSGLPVFHPKGGTVRRADGGLLAPAPRGGGLRVRQHAPHHQGRALRDLGAPRLVRRGHVPAHGARRGPAVLPEADELPVPHPHLQEPPALLPRAAAPALRVRHGLPLRAVRVSCTV